MKLLIVDDSEECVMAIKCLLLNKGYEIEFVNNTRDAVISFNSNQYDIFLVNHKIGEECGLILATEILKLSPFVPIVILLKNSDDTVFKKCMEIGVSDVLEKNEITVSVLNRVISYSIERTKHLSTIKKHENMFEAFMESSPVVAFMKDNNGKYIYVNKTLLNHFDMIEKDWIGKDDIDIFGPELGKQLMETDRHVIETKTKIELIEFVPTNKNEFVKWLSYKFPFQIQGKDVIAGLAFQDFDSQLEDLKKILTDEMETKTFNAINSFISGISHEIRSPLQALDTAADLLIDESKGEFSMDEKTRKDTLTMLKNSTSYIESVISNCVSFGTLSGMENKEDMMKTIMIDMKNINLSNHITKTIEIFSYFMEYKKNQVEIDIDIPKNLKCVAPNNVLRHIIINLLSNALRAISTYKGKEYVENCGKVTIRAFVENYATVIEIEDNGRGIPKAAKQKLFNPFYRAYRDVPGMGLGLYLCKVWASSANMDLILKHSEPGKTIFRIALRESVC